MAQNVTLGLSSLLKKILMKVPGKIFHPQIYTRAQLLEARLALTRVKYHNDL